MRLRVFVFEDDELVRSLLWRMLDMRGYEVFTFPDPHLCPLHVSKACQCAPGQACGDVIISDLDMPNVRGLEFVEAQLAKGCKCVNVALMSGNWSESELERTREIGCKVFAKPFQLNEIDRWLDEIEKQTDPNRELFDWFIEDFRASDPALRKDVGESGPDEP